MKIDKSISLTIQTLQIDQTFQKLQNGITSDYLGKINYKPKQRHKLPTAPRNIRLETI